MSSGFQRVIDDIGSASLALFIVMALMTLKLWVLANLALPLSRLRVAGRFIAACLHVPIWWFMGKDTCAVLSGVFADSCSAPREFMANMESLVERYGPRRARFLRAMVGAFLIDFTNAIIITVCLNIWG